MLFGIVRGGVSVRMCRLCLGCVWVWGLGRVGSWSDGWGEGWMERGVGVEARLGS